MGLGYKLKFAILTVLLSSISTSLVLAAISDFVNVEPKLKSQTTAALLINKEDTVLVQKENQSVMMKINPSTVYKSDDELSSFKVNVYKWEKNDRKLVNARNYTIQKRMAAQGKDYFFKVTLGNLSGAKEKYEFEVFDTKGGLLNTYLQEFKIN